MATEQSAGRADVPDDDTPDDDTPELIVKLRERKERHKQRNIVQRAAIVVFGVLVVLAGIVMSGPGVPGPGIAVILIGISFLALEFDSAERLLERAIVWADGLKDRAEESSTAQRITVGLLTAAAVAGFVVAAVLWDIPLVPIL